MIFRSAFSIFTFSVLLTLSGCSKKQQNSLPNEINSTNIMTSKDLKVDENNLSHAQILIRTAKGNIVLKLYPTKAPSTVTRFLALVQNGFYDGLKFHRVHPGFLIQTGDPTETGKGGSGAKIKAEFNKLQHIKGTVAMARNPKDEDSADSQFYISLATLPHLDSNFTVFGQVTEGLEILDLISLNDKVITISLQL